MEDDGYRERQLERLAIVVDEARRIAPDAVVFGSLLREGLPGDVDIMFHGDPYGPEAGRLLALARRHYGWLDVFVAPERGRLMVRNPEATAYVPAAKAREIRAAAAQGTRLGDYDMRSTVAPRGAGGQRQPESISDLDAVKPARL